MPVSILQPHVNELAQIVGSVFDTMLRLETSPTGEAPPKDSRMLTAAVYLAGKYRGAVLVHCLPEQARAFTGQFLSAEAPREADDQVRDLLGELANMIAGNLKGSLLPGTQLSVPSVVEGSVSALRVCGGQPPERFGFSSGAGPFWIAVILQED